jgi:hypothetical protein
VRRDDLSDRAAGVVGDQIEPIQAQMINEFQDTAGQPGQFKGPDFRALIKQDQDLLSRMPVEQTARRAELQRSIDVRIDDLISATDRSRAYRALRVCFVLATDS